jgi:hypothetical protein
MATESATQEARADHVRSVTVTTIAALAGIAGALGSATLTADLPPEAAATSTRALYALIGAIGLQFPLLRLFGIDPSEFGAKDVLYVVFMTFSLWFVVWAVLLTSGVSL